MGTRSVRTRTQASMPAHCIEKVTLTVGERTFRTGCIHSQTSTGNRPSALRSKISRTNQLARFAQLVSTSMGCGFHGHPAIDSMNIRPPIPRTSGHPQGRQQRRINSLPSTSFIEAERSSWSGYPCVRFEKYCVSNLRSVCSSDIHQLASRASHRR